MTSEEIVARARALIGTRFRPQGRDPEQGLDCIGVVMMATGVPNERVRRNYALRAGDPEEIHGGLQSCGFIRIAPNRARAADVLVVRPGPAALHLLVLTQRGYVHADTRRRRVVEVPGPVPWPVLSAWRDPCVAKDDPLAVELVGPSRRSH